MAHSWWGKGLWQIWMHHWTVHAKVELPGFPPDVRTGGHPFHNFGSWTQKWSFALISTMEFPAILRGMAPIDCQKLECCKIAVYWQSAFWQKFWQVKFTWNWADLLGKYQYRNIKIHESLLSPFMYLCFAFFGWRFGGGFVHNCHY